MPLTVPYRRLFFPTRSLGLCPSGCRWQLDELVPGLESGAEAFDVGRKPWVIGRELERDSKELECGPALAVHLEQAGEHLG